LHVKLKIFSRPAGFVAKMLRFDENFHRNFQPIFLLSNKILFSLQMDPRALIMWTLEQ
jgi:hypothetical protein